MLRVLAAVLLALVLAGCADAPVATPAPNPDAAFLSGMIPHHEQALELTAMVGGRDGSPGLDAIALRIDREQVEEIGQMQGLMRARGLAPVAAGMMPGMMHGMADPATLATLRSSRGPAFERLWLDTMISHHDGALMMARDYLATGTDDTLRRYARTLVVAQSGEIEAMRAMRTNIAGP